MYDVKRLVVVDDDQAWHNVIPTLAAAGFREFGSNSSTFLQDPDTEIHSVRHLYSPCRI
jgi:hypothetical protein